MKLLWLIPVILPIAGCQFFFPNPSEHYATILPLLKQWSTKTTHVKKLILVLDDPKDTFQVPRSIFEDLDSTTNLFTLEHLMSLHSPNNSLDFQSVESDTCVLLLTTDLQSLRRAMRSHHLMSFWQPENLYILQDGNADPYDSSHREFLEWSLERLWRFRRVHKIVVSVGGKFVRYDPFKYENHAGRYARNTSCWYCVEANKNNAMLSVGTDVDLSEYFDDYREQFHGYPLKVSVFEMPTMTRVGHRFSGMDYNYATEIARMMNVTLVFLESKLQYGWEENGKFYGTLGDIVYRRADVAFNQFFVKDYLTRQVEFAVPLTGDKLCAVVPKAPRIPKHLIIYKIFTIKTWILIVAGHFAISVIYTTIKGRPNKSGPVYLGRFSSCYFPSVGEHLANAVLQISQPFGYVEPRTSERLLVLSSLFLSLILNGVFTSQLTSSFNKIGRYDDIHTLRELDRSGLVILTSSKDLIEDALTDKDSKLIKRLHARMRYANDSEIERRVFLTKDAGMLHRAGLIPLRFNEHQKEKVHIVEECPKDYILAHLVTKGSPFLSRINSILGRLNNGGFYDKWFQGMSRSVKQHRAPGQEKSNVHRKLTMRHMVIPFVTLSVGLAISAIVLVCERRRTNFSSHVLT